MLFRIGRHLFQKMAAALLLMGCLCQLVLPSVVSAQSVIYGDIKHVEYTSELNMKTLVPYGGKMVDMVFRNVPVKDALRALAKKGKFNLLVDNSVQGNISVDLTNVSINDALETMKTYGNLVYAQEKGALMVAAASSPKGRNIRQRYTQVFPLKYANAKVAASTFNLTILPAITADSSDGVTRVVADSQTNSIVAIGTPKELKAIGEHLQVLDKPRETKTWRLSHANVLDVAAILNASLFNDRAIMPGLSLSGGGSGSGGGGGVVEFTQPSSLRVREETIEEGSASTASGGTSIGNSISIDSGGASASASSGSSSGASSATGLRRFAKADATVGVSPDGPILIPDSRLNTLTLLATAQQIEMADALIPTLDRKLPQVVIETALVEVSDEGRKELGFNFGWSSGKFGVGVNQTQAAVGGIPTYSDTNPFSRPVGMLTQPFEQMIQFSTNSIRNTRGFVYQINALLNNRKAKLLANPSIMTTHESEAVISIVDEIIKSITVNITGNAAGVPITTTEPNFCQAGIIMNILPKIGANGTITLRIRPTVSTVRDVVQDSFGNEVTLLSKRESVAQEVVLKDGESFIISGLINDTNTNAVSKVPGLGDMPVLGALFRNSEQRKRRSELVMVVTPHLVQDGSLPSAGLNTYSSGSSTGASTYQNQTPSQMLHSQGYGQQAQQWQGQNGTAFQQPSAAPYAPVKKSSSPSPSQSYQPKATRNAKPRDPNNPFEHPEQFLKNTSANPNPQNQSAMNYGNPYGTASYNDQMNDSEVQQIVRQFGN